MPPKKKGTPAAINKTQEKKTAGRQRKKNAYSQNDSNGAETNDTEIVISVTPTRTRKSINKKLTEEEKIAMANEVVQLQFPKQKFCFKSNIINKAPIYKKPVLKRKLIQNKKKVINNELSVAQEATDCTNQTEEPVVKKRKYVRKSLKPDVIMGENNDSCQEKTKMPKNSNNKKTTVKRLVNKKMQSCKDKAMETTVKAPKRKLSLNRKKDFQNLNLVRTIVNDYIPDANTQEHNESLTSTVLNGDINKESNPKINDSRRNSFISTSEFSWTKDISSSSTTTCVTVSTGDFVCIDRKIPVLKLNKIDQTLNKQNNDVKLNKSVITTKSTEIPENDINDENGFDISSNSLHLSTSTASPQKSLASPQKSLASPQKSLASPQKSPATPQKSPAKELHQTALEKLGFLENYDMDIINWIGYDTENVDDIQFYEELVKENLFQEERELLLNRNIIRLLSNDENIEDSCSEYESKVNISLNNNEERHGTNVNNLNSAIEETVLESARKSNDSEKDNENTNRSKHIEDDDDDALSLFAESITGFESSQKSSHNVSDAPVMEEYIPQPVVEVFKIPKPVTYNPSKIKQKPHVSQICEKQKADSTSLQVDFLNSENSESLSTVNFVSKNPCLMGLLFKPIELVKSTVFKGVCVFNLINKCKNSNNSCHFLHVTPPASVISSKLLRLPYEEFVQEYMMLRNFPNLRYLYGLCYIDDCVRRHLSRILVEMAMDFINKSDNSKPDVLLKTEAVERTLLYLNHVDLNTCSDLLRYEIRPGVLLCDKFLEVIGQSQNFSRFRTVFINLTMFMCRGDRTFNSDVASQILERVCILPYELGVARALMEIIKRTDPVVLSNTMCEHFEKKLLNANKELCEDFLHLKKLSLSDSRSQGDNQNSLNVPDKEIRYSPDTTNFDNSNKTHESKLTRTIDLNQLPIASSMPGPSGLQRRSTRWGDQGSDKPDFSSPMCSTEDRRMQVQGELRSQNRRDIRWLGPRGFTPQRPRRFKRSFLNGFMTPNFPRRPGPGYF